MCVPYSEEACHDASQSLGLSLGGMGYPFAGYFPVKGCYSLHVPGYAEAAFYGIGGTEEETMAELSTPYYRPEGYDCLGE